MQGLLLNRFELITGQKPPREAVQFDLNFKTILALVEKKKESMISMETAAHVEAAAGASFKCRSIVWF